MLEYEVGGRGRGKYEMYPGFDMCDFEKSNSLIY